MTDPLGVALLGCGRIAQYFHLKRLVTMPGVALTALAEPDPERRAQAQRLVPGAALYEDYHALLTDADAQAVVITLPTFLHAEAAIAAFAAGKHVYLEKPLATNVAEAREVVEAWQRAGTVGMIGFNFRFNPLMVRAREVLSSGMLGTVVGARTLFTAAARPFPAWKERRAQGGGALLDLGSHHIDLLHYLFDSEAESVWAGLRSHRSEDDQASLTLRMPSGALVHSFFSATATDEHRFEIMGDAGRLAVDLRSSDFSITRPTTRLARVRRLAHTMRSLGPRRLMRSPGTEPSFDLALQAFVGAVRGKRPATPDLMDGYRSLAVIEAAEEAARSGQAVSLEQRLSPTR